MSDIRQPLERQSEWQKRQASLSWPEKIHLAEAMREVSNAGESHPYVLSEPYLNLSAHTAPTMEPRRMPICQCANNPGSRREIRLTQCVARRI